MGVIRHDEQRVAILIDTQNLYHSAKNLYKSKVNFGAVVAAGFGAPDTVDPPPLLFGIGIAVELIPDIIKILRYIN
jgi:hypothetical protein